MKTIKDIKTETKKLIAINNYADRRTLKTNYLDTNFKSAYSWNLASKIIDELLTHGSTTRDDAETIAE